MSTRLVLTRRKGQSIVIGDDIKVTVSESIGGQVKLAIIAPETVSVDREEVRIAKLQNRAKAAAE